MNNDVHSYVEVKEQTFSVRQVRQLEISMGHKKLLTSLLDCQLTMARDVGSNMYQLSNVGLRDLKN